MDLRAQRNRFVAFAFASSDLLIEASLDGTVRVATGAAAKLFGIDAATLADRNIHEFFLPTERSLVVRALNTVSIGQRFGPVLLAPREGGPSPRISMSGCRLPESPDTIHLTLSAAHVSSAISEAVPRRDADTGLTSADAFQTAATEAIGRARVLDEELRLSLLHMVDLDAFSDRAGDAAVRNFMAESGAYLRTLAVNDAGARLAADRFGILHRADADTDMMAREIGRLSREVDPRRLGIIIDRSSIAVDRELDEQDAARALVYSITSYTRDAGNTPTFDSLRGALDSKMREAIARLGELKREIYDHRMRFVAQPIVEISTMAVTLHELLVRFDTGREVIEDISFAEDTGLVCDLDRTVIERASVYLARPPAQGPKSLSVNISGRSLMNGAFMSWLTGHLDKRRDIGGRLAFEITESSAMEELAAANAIIQRLRSLGFRVGLDDFGAGVTSFQYLRSLDIDFVKIEGAYVREALDAPREQAMLKAIATLCRDLKTDMIAERVETKEQAMALRFLGVRFAQGYHFGHPKALPANFGLDPRAVGDSPVQTA